MMVFRTWLGRQVRAGSPHENLLKIVIFKYKIVIFSIKTHEEWRSTASRLPFLNEGHRTVACFIIIKSMLFNRKSGFFDRKSGFLNRKSGFFH